MAPRTEYLTLPGGHKLRVYTNYPLLGGTIPDRAVVVVHGTDRNAEDYWRWTMDGASKAGHSAALVVAPLFDSAWSSNDWKDGDGGPVSSYAALDQLLGMVADKARFSNIKRIVITGHSAGGQVTQRYAAVGNAPAPVSYVVMNPSSYVYLDKWRPVANPCSSFNRWKYGLDKRNGYVAALTPAEVAARYTSRQVVIANGSLDTKDNHSMDTSCSANAQGKHRSARGKAYADRIKALYPSAPHSYIVVPGVGHDGQAMLSAPALRSVLYG